MAGAAQQQKMSLFQTSLLHHTSTPSTLSAACLGSHHLVYSAGRHVCYFNITTGKERHYVPLPDGVFAAKCLAASGNLVALATSGIHPSIYLFKVSVDGGIKSEMLYVIPKVAELDVTDMKFSGCGARLFVLSKASTNVRFLVYNTIDGSLLPGCEAVQPPLAMDRLVPNPQNKDAVFLCNDARRLCHLVTLSRKFKRYIVTLHAAAPTVPEVIEGEAMAPLEG